ncbi:MAG: 4Fe-4S binding protein [Acidobacteria bacterium]|nr:4Fe-4S binding protein [Acidobacteriota bacterium]
MVRKIIYSSLFLSLFSLGGLAQDTAEIARHATEKSPGFFDFLVMPQFITKYVVMIIIALLAFALLKTRKMQSGIKVLILVISTLLFGIAGNFVAVFAMHPSPMCAVEKSMLFGFRIPMIITLAVILLLTFVGPRLFCGWVCPVGAVQELVAMLADRLNLKRIKYNFILANGIRIGIFLAFLFLSVTMVLTFTHEGRVFPLSIYNYINAFHGFEFGAQPSALDYVINFLPLVLSLVLAFKLYRPFCHLVCPIGMVTHFTEQFSLYKIRLKTDACTDCGICVKKAPCPAMPEILKSATLRPDCFACNVCLDVCPEDALDVGLQRTIRS